MNILGYNRDNFHTGTVKVSENLQVEGNLEVKHEQIVIHPSQDLEIHHTNDDKDTEHTSAVFLEDGNVKFNNNIYTQRLIMKNVESWDTTNQKNKTFYEDNSEVMLLRSTAYSQFSFPQNLTSTVYIVFKVLSITNNYQFLHLRVGIGKNSIKSGLDPQENTDVLIASNLLNIAVNDEYKFELDSSKNYTITKLNDNSIIQSSNLNLAYQEFPNYNGTWCFYIKNSSVTIGTRLKLIDAVSTDSKDGLFLTSEIITDKTFNLRNANNNIIFSESNDLVTFEEKLHLKNNVDIGTYTPNNYTFVLPSPYITFLSTNKYNIEYNSHQINSFRISQHLDIKTFNYEVIVDLTTISGTDKTIMLSQNSVANNIYTPNDTNSTAGFAVAVDLMISTMGVNIYWKRGTINPTSGVTSIAGSNTEKIKFTIVNGVVSVFVKFQSNNNYTSVGSATSNLFFDGVDNLFVSVNKRTTSTISAMDINVEVIETDIDAELTFKENDSLINFNDSLILAKGNSVFLELDDEQIYLNKPPVLPSFNDSQMVALTTLDNGTMVYNSEIKQSCIKIENITQSGNTKAVFRPMGNYQATKIATSGTGSVKYFQSTFNEVYSGFRITFTALSTSYEFLFDVWVIDANNGNNDAFLFQIYDNIGNQVLGGLNNQMYGSLENEKDRDFVNVRLYATDLTIGNTYQVTPRAKYQSGGGGYMVWGNSSSPQTSARFAVRPLYNVSTF